MDEISIHIWTGFISSMLCYPSESPNELHYITRKRCSIGGQRFIFFVGVECNIGWLVLEIRIPAS